jgi:uncharacterized protein YdeI (YjbR/CyaY-like superfamily)
VKPVYFRSAKELASWLREHGGSAAELWIGFYKKDSGKAGITYREALDEALCTGWIDGIRKGVDEKRFRQRFTPRRKKSIWSAINIRRVGELTAARRMKPAGLAAFERRQSGPAPYSFESPRELDAAAALALRRDVRARAWFEAQPPSYRRTASFWVMSAKQEATRERRLRTLIDSSRRGEPIPPLRWMRKRR